MLANPIKGEVAVTTATDTFTLVYSWTTQRAIGRRFGKPCREVLDDVDEMADDDVAFIWWAGFQHHHPNLTETETDAIVNELGAKAMYTLMGDAFRLAFDAGPAAAVDAPADPRKGRGRDGTSTPASTSGSASTPEPPTTSG